MRDGLRLIEEAIHFTRSADAVDCVLLALQWNDERLRKLICERLQVLPIPVLLLPDQHVLSIFSSVAAAAREFTVELQRPPLSSRRAGTEARSRSRSRERSAHRAAPLFLVRCPADQVGIRRPRDLLAAAQGLQRPGVHHLQIPHDERPRGRPRHSPGAQERSARHARRPHPSRHQHRRAAAAPQRRARAHVAHRAAAARRRPRRRL